MARILIADDSEVLRKQVVAVVDSHPGWSVCGEAVNGVSAILKAHELKPDLVIMDLVMPMLDGLQSAAEIAKFHPTIPIVIYSLQVLPELEIEAKKYGVWAMVSKSAEQSLLIATAERLLAASPPHNVSNTIETGADAAPAKTTQATSVDPLDAQLAPPLTTEPA